MELTTKDYLHCNGNKLKNFHIIFFYWGKSVQPICAFGLFLGKMQIIKQQCYHVLTQHKSNITLPWVFSLNNGSYLISFLNTIWTQTCQGKLSKTINGCKLCIVNVPCNCLIAASTFILMPRLHSCVKHSTMFIRNQLLLHAPTLINEVFNKSRSATLTRRMGSKLSSFNVLRQELAQSVTSTMLQCYSITKIIQWRLAMILSVMSATLGYISNRIVSNSIS
jgi:hypothetical protein